MQTSLTPTDNTPKNIAWRRGVWFFFFWHAAILPIGIFLLIATSLLGVMRFLQPGIDVMSLRWVAWLAGGCTTVFLLLSPVALVIGARKKYWAATVFGGLPALTFTSVFIAVLLSGTSQTAVGRVVVWFVPIVFITEFFLSIRIMIDSRRELRKLNVVTLGCHTDKHARAIANQAEMLKVQDDCIIDTAQAPALHLEGQGSAPHLERHHES
jgi:hypothetical protein